ncbi:hypothetical protein Anas_13387 [Armadillidium nasatum]|uniref:Uncharacterized protein n=1 Tax=Armadillidium nasatum TaxID=96803 RepID=A0A5N5TDC5_9CRUS|nr:hypothetical protein Anas_13387 [Armadillidium nasatum]
MEKTRDITGKKKITEKCGTDQTCIAAAEKCMGDKDAKPPVDDKMTDIEKLAAFNKCLESHGKGADIINEQDCANRPGSEGQREGRSRHFEKCKKETLGYLRGLEDSGDAAAGDIRCCFFQAIGVEMVSSDNSINLDFFRQHLKDRISNEGVHGFRECVMDECIRRMQNT